ncbi:MAG: glycosyltransferase family 39 protein, partial [Turicibacter sp.]
MREIKIKGKLMALFNIVFCITFGYIFFDTLVNPSQLFAKINPVIVVILAAGVITGMYKLNSLLEKATRKNLILMSILSFLIIAFLQLFFIKFFKVTPLWDFGTVYESAYNALDSFTQFDSYFYNCYPNNIPLFIFMASIIKMLDSMGIGNFY